MNHHSKSVSPDLVAYCDRFDYRPGEAVDIHVHGDGMVGVDLVRLRMGDGRVTALPLEEEVPGIARQMTEAHPQETHPGSFALVENLATLADAAAVTIDLWIWPTLPDGAGEQGLVSTLNDRGGSGFSLVLAAGGHLELRLGSSSGWRVAARSERPLLPRLWYRVGARISLRDGVARLSHHLKRALPDDAGAADVEARLEAGTALASAAGWLLIGAGLLRRDGAGRPSAEQCFNGKIEAVSLGIARQSDQRPAASASWDFARDIASDRVVDVSGHEHHGRLYNMPARAVTGHDWRGDEVDFRHAPDQYAAIHFHDDDLDDARWSRAARVHLPDDLPSGIYAVRIIGERGEDRVPIFVLPKESAARPPIAFLVPTFCYQAYANIGPVQESSGGDLSELDYVLGPRDRQLLAHPDLIGSLYDHHRDGSPRCYSTMRRPVLNFRADDTNPMLGAPRHFPADLYLTGWLEHRGHAYDVLTDHALDEHGADLLAGYRVLITGSHPEYFSGRMLDAVERFVAGGGRLMYLGGNGFYWVTSRDPQRPHVIEVRRGHGGTRTASSAPGEGHHSTTGELGGLWRYRGRPPNALVGVGMTSQGWDRKAPGFERTDASRDPRFAWIFDGIDADRFGEEGLVMGGASGDELDRFDTALGSPPHGVVLATSLPHSNYYKFVIEDLTMIVDGLGGAGNDKVRSDMTYVDWPEGGAVFSVGSICWAGALAWNDFDNDVERITRNVLDRFLAAKPGH